MNPELARQVERWAVVLEQTAARLEKELGVECEVWSLRVGQNTPFDGYSLGLNCPTLKPHEDYERVELELTFRNVSCHPLLVKAEIAESFPAFKFDPDPWSGRQADAELMRRLDDHLPTLLDQFSQRVVEGVRPRAVATISVDLEYADPAPSMQATGAEPDYLVIQAAFEQLFGDCPGEPLILSPTASGWGGDEWTMAVVDRRWLEAMPGLSAELLASARSRNKVSLVHPPQFRLGGRATLFINRDEIPRQARDFYRLYPLCPGWFSFSRPGYSGDGNQALLRFARSTRLPDEESEPTPRPAERNSYSGLCLLKKVDGTWRVDSVADDTSLMKSLQPEDFSQMAEARFRQEVESGGYSILDLESGPFGPGRARLRCPDGRVVTVVTWHWLSDRLIGTTDAKPTRDFFLSRDPVLLVNGMDQSSLEQGLEGDWTASTVRGTTEHKALQEVNQALRHLIVEGSDLASLELRGAVETGSARGYEWNSWQDLSLLATLKDGQTLEFSIELVYDDHQTKKRKPVERLLVLNGLTPQRMVDAVEAYLAERSEK
ncbi:MAG: hypothetical protein AB7S38_10405 [Vulcanimicrobiota bacterium]